MEVTVTAFLVKTVAAAKREVNCIYKPSALYKTSITVFFLLRDLDYILSARLHVVLSLCEKGNEQSR